MKTLNAFDVAEKECLPERGESSIGMMSTLNNVTELTSLAREAGLKLIAINDAAMGLSVGHCDDDSGPRHDRPDGLLPRIDHSLRDLAAVIKAIAAEISRTEQMVKK